MLQSSVRPRVRFAAACPSFPARVSHGRLLLAKSGKAPETQTKTQDQANLDNCEFNLAGEYCSIDGTGKRVNQRSLAEMEQEYLAALTSWFYEGKATMPDEEFELLKEELLWQGSKVPVLDVEESAFIEASMAYAKGKPVMSDEEYDALKNSLRQKNSVVTAQGPRCSIRSKKMYSDATPDYLRMTLLNIPAAVAVLGALFAVDFPTGFEISKVISLPPPLGTFLLWGIVLPTCYVISTSITNVLFKDNIILKAPCPNCNTETFTYFGDILTVPGNRGSNVVDCPGCNASLTYDEFKRVLVLSETPEEKNKKAAAAAAKKAASAAKKAGAAAKKA